MTREQGRWLDGLGLEDWKRRPLKYLYRRTKVLGTGEQQLLSIYRDYGVVPRVGREDNFNKPSEDLSKYQLVAKGDLVVNKMKAWQGSVAVSEYDGVISPAYFVYRPTGGVDSRYAHYLLRSNEYFQYYASISSGVRPNQWDLDPRQFERMEVLLPSLEVQRRIADYLDHETTQIDNFVADVLRMLALLEERTKVEIRMLLDEFGKFDDGELRKLSWDLQISSGQYLSTANFEKEPTEGAEVPVYGGNGIVGYTDTALIVDKTVIIGRVGANCGNVHVTAEPVWVTDNALVAKQFSNRYLPEYLALALEYLELNSLADRTAQPLITGSAVSRQKIPAPSKEKQEALVAEVTRIRNETVALVEELRSAMDLARERRSALISAAVTGRLDVSGVGVGV